MADLKTGKGESERTQMSTAEQQRSSSDPRGLARRELSNWLASPFDLFERMTEEMDRTFDRMSRDFGFGRSMLSPRGLFGAGSARQPAVWAPRVEAFQKDDRFSVRAELPGLKKEDVQVELNEDAITIQGERRYEHEEERSGYHHSELSYGQFYRRIPLPEGVIADSAKATFKNGVLEVTMQAAPSEANRGRRLEISDAK